VTNTCITCNAICPGWVLTPLVQKQVEARAKGAGMTLAAVLENSGGGRFAEDTAMADETSTATHKPPLCSKCGHPMQLDRMVPRVLYHPGLKTYVCRPSKETVTVPDEQ
jgi:NAD(P)-dependent dehydrogenase (short-subunit alcohol dehydrogenase family)